MSTLKANNNLSLETNFHTYRVTPQSKYNLVTNLFSSDKYKIFPAGGLLRRSTMVSKKASVNSSLYTTANIIKQLLFIFNRFLKNCFWLALHSWTSQVIIDLPSAARNIWTEHKSFMSSSVREKRLFVSTSN